MVRIARCLMGITLVAFFCFVATGQHVRASSAPTPARERVFTPAVGPAVLIHEAVMHRYVLDDDNDGDMVLLIRYELSLDLWCDELENDDGCDADPIAPTEPTSLALGAVSLTYYTDTDAVEVLRSLVRAPRIDHSLGGIYWSAGHGLTWGDTDVKVCVEVSETLYDAPQSTSCMAVTWNTADATMEAQRAILGAGARQMLMTIQDERGEALGTYVSHVNLITPNGQVLTREAFGWLDRVAPTYFATGADTLFIDDYTPAAGEPALQATLDAEPTAVAFGELMDTAATEFFGMQGVTVATFVVVVLGVEMAGLGWAVTRKPLMAGIGFFIPVTVGMYVRAPTIGVVFTLILLATVALVLWFARQRMPS